MTLRIDSQYFPITNTPNPHADVMDMATQPDDTQEEEAPQEPNQAQAIELRDLARTSLLTFTAAVLRPHQMYFDRFEEIQIDITLKKLSYTDTNEDAAAAAKERLGLEDTAPPELVKDLI